MTCQMRVFAFACVLRTIISTCKYDIVLISTNILEIIHNIQPYEYVINNAIYVMNLNKSVNI